MAAWDCFFYVVAKLYFGEATLAPLLSYYSVNGSNVFLQLCFLMSQTSAFDGMKQMAILHLCAVCEYGEDLC